MSCLLGFSLMLFLPIVAFAAGPDANELAPVPEPPDLPAPVQSGEEMEPDITIIRKGKDTIQEFRRNGKLYMVKIQPQVGPAYYMLDTNGDEQMDVKKNDLDENTNINKWTLFEWDFN
ncbi:DUF2782 domain-containing protein [Methylomonas sp. ZR1]|nr:DUF2782 domain-containing protein [Methylomonas sp. ZR1]